jgi:hypothetical protein
MAASAAGSLAIAGPAAYQALQSFPAARLGRGGEAVADHAPMSTFMPERTPDEVKADGEVVFTQQAAI